MYTKSPYERQTTLDSFPKINDNSFPTSLQNSLQHNSLQQKHYFLENSFVTPTKTRLDPSPCAPSVEALFGRPRPAYDSEDDVVSLQRTRAEVDDYSDDSPSNVEAYMVALLPLTPAPAPKEFPCAKYVEDVNDLTECFKELTISADKSDTRCVVVDDSTDGDATDMPASAHHAVERVIDMRIHSVGRPTVTSPNVLPIPLTPPPSPPSSPSPPTATVSPPQPTCRTSHTSALKEYGLFASMLNIMHDLKLIVLNTPWEACTRVKDGNLRFKDKDRLRRRS
jgi:hypothetical protein